MVKFIIKIQSRTQRSFPQRLKYFISISTKHLQNVFLYYLENIEKYFSFYCTFKFKYMILSYYLEKPPQLQPLITSSPSRVSCFPPQKMLYVALQKSRVVTTTTIKVLVIPNQGKREKKILLSTIFVFLINQKKLGLGPDEQIKPAHIITY